MPEINPLTNDQIFLKKIAENTGSDYETGDVSEINPLTIEQILLKEIAANTAGQSGDITELEGKVAANTSAIEAITNVTGSCNLANSKKAVVVSPDAGITWTINDDYSVTVNGTATANTALRFDFADIMQNVVVKGGATDIGIAVQLADDSWIGIEDGDTVETLKKFSLNVENGTTINNVTVYPMLYDARLNPTGYVPYAMTNRELTDEVEELAESVKNTSIDIRTALHLQYNGCVKILHFSGCARAASTSDPFENISSYGVNPTRYPVFATGVIAMDGANNYPCTLVCNTNGEVEVYYKDGTDEYVAPEGKVVYGTLTWIL